MTTAQLYTRDLKFVTSVQVPEVTPAEPQACVPQVIVWGYRCFVRGLDGFYREGAAYLVPLEQTKEEVL